MASYRLRLNLLYKDGTRHELTMAVPPEVGDEIAQKGLVATQVFVDKFIQVAVPDTAIFDKFKKG